MTQSPDTASQSAEGELVLTRVFDAPRGLVFKAWTEPEHFKRWWGPKGFTTPVCNIDLRVGGMMHFLMRAPEDQHMPDMWARGIFREIVEPERIVYSDSFSDENGNLVQPSEYGMANWPAEALVTVTFEDVGGKTRLTLRHSFGIVPGADRDGAEQGWSESLDRLAEFLAQA